MYHGREEENFKFLHPFSLNVAGITQSGKTTFVEKLLRQSSSCVDPPPSKIVFSYTEEQPVYKDLKNSLSIPCEFINGLDFEIDDFQSDRNTLLVIDDQMNSALDSSKVQDLFTRGMHHRYVKDSILYYLFSISLLAYRSVSLIVLTQNLFPKGKHGRDMRLNCQYITIMKSPTFASQIRYLGQQMFPRYPKFLPEAYSIATEKPFSYLVVNLHPLCEEAYRGIQGIFDGEDKFVYQPK